MSKEKQNNLDISIEKVLKKVGHRLQPDEEIKQEVYTNVREIWLQQNKTPFYQNRFFLAAASMFLFVSFYAFFSIQIENSTLDDHGISSAINISGQIEISQDNNNWSFLDIKTTLKSGDYLKTQSNNRLLVKLTNNNVFRLDENTSVHIVDLETLELNYGQIYIESSESSNFNPLLIKTNFASINHIGTQYSIQVTDDSVNVRVRDGKVVINDIQNSDNQRNVERGYEVTLKQNGQYSENPITPFDSKWQWTQNIVNPLDIQDKTVAQYLSWISAETGYPITWNSMTDKSNADKIKLSGSINGLKPLESLDVILPTTSFTYQVSASEIHISH